MEYTATLQRAEQVFWLRRLSVELRTHRPIVDEEKLPPTPVLTDRTGAIALATRPSILERNKHIDLRTLQTRSYLISTYCFFKPASRHDHKNDFIIANDFKYIHQLAEIVLEECPLFCLTRGTIAESIC